MSTWEVPGKLTATWPRDYFFLKGKVSQLSQLLWLGGLSSHVVSRPGMTRVENSNPIHPGHQRARYWLDGFGGITHGKDPLAAQNKNSLKTQKNPSRFPRDTVWNTGTLQKGVPLLGHAPNPQQDEGEGPPVERLE